MDIKNCGFMRRREAVAIVKPKRKSKRITQYKTPKLPEHGRSGYLIAKNDSLIKKFLKDPNYQVLDNGIILTNISRQGHLTDTWRVKALTYDKAYLSFNYHKRTLQVHRIVYHAFVGKLKCDLVINHIDGNSTNNHPSNLELVTQAQNNRHRLLGP